MKSLLFVILSFCFVNAYALDPFEFTCDLNGVAVQSVPGMKKAPENPVVGLNIKVIKEQVPLYLIKATFDGVEKDLFTTDWAKRDQLSQEGEDLLQLLSLFFGIDTTNLDSLRAGLPTNLLDSFAYLELKDTAGTVVKLGFEGTDPYFCQ